MNQEGNGGRAHRGACRIGYMVDRINQWWKHFGTDNILQLFNPRLSRTVASIIVLEELLKHFFRFEGVVLLLIFFTIIPPL